MYIEVESKSLVHTCLKADLADIRQWAVLSYFKYRLSSATVHVQWAPVINSFRSHRLQAFLLAK